MKTPTVSVIMSAYNGQEYLEEAITSILSQIFTDFEFIIIDDASTDSTASIIEKFKDPRIVLIHNERNIGLALSLNKGIEKARGEFIVRMDADDMSMPTRLDVQVSYMQDHQNIMIAGAYATTTNHKGEFIMKNPTDPREVAVNLLFRTSLIHPTVIMRRDFLNAHSLRYQDTATGVGYVEDYDLWTRAVQHGQVSNMPHVVLYYRSHPEQVSSSKQAVQIANAQEIIARQLKHVGMSPTPEDLYTAVSVKRYLFLKDQGFLKKLEKLLMQIYAANIRTRIYDDDVLRKVLGNIWIETAIAFQANGIDMWHDFYNSKVRGWVRYDLRNIYRFAKILYSHLKRMRSTRLGQE